MEKDTNTASIAASATRALPGNPAGLAPDCELFQQGGLVFFPFRVRPHRKIMRYGMFLILCQLLAAAPFDLDTLRWNNRVILVFAPSLDAEPLRQQRRFLADNSCGLHERDLTVATVGSATGETFCGKQLSGAEVRKLRRRFGVERDDFTVLLVGKDGGVKLRKSEIVKPSEFYRLIDQMPMRIQEARAARAGGAPACLE